MHTFGKSGPLSIMVVALLLLIIGIFTALFFDSIRYTKYVEPGMVGMEPRDVYEIIKTKSPNEYVFLDVRSAGEYEKLHAEQSVNTPIAELYDLWKTLPRNSDKTIYLICTGGRLSGVAYGFLQLHGFRNIVHVTGGVQNWVNQGMPSVAPSLFQE